MTQGEIFEPQLKPAISLTATKALLMEVLISGNVWFKVIPKTLWLGKYKSTTVLILQRKRRPKQRRWLFPRQTGIKSKSAIVC